MGSSQRPYPTQSHVSTKVYVPWPGYYTWTGQDEKGQSRGELTGLECDLGRSPKGRLCQGQESPETLEEGMVTSSLKRRELLKCWNREWTMQTDTWVTSKRGRRITSKVPFSPSGVWWQGSDKKELCQLTDQLCQFLSKFVLAIRILKRETNVLCGAQFPQALVVLLCIFKTLHRFYICFLKL